MVRRTKIWLEVRFGCFPFQISSNIGQANLPWSYRTTLFQLCLSFCRSLHSNRESIRLIPSPLCPSCRVEPHTTARVFPAPRTPPLTERNLWERPRLTSEFLFASLSLISRLFLPYPSSPSF